MGRVPEGDTVWLTARTLDGALRGAVLTASEFRVPQLATVDLAGRTVVETVARGKHLLTRFDHGKTLHSHLRMDGSWRVRRAGERWPAPARLVRVVLHTTEWQAVGVHLHELRLLPTSEENMLVGQLGPDLLGPDWDPTEAVRRLRAQPQRSIGPALLDQRNLAGIGNLYKAETLFLRGVHPWTRVADVPDLATLVDLAHRLMMANKDRWEQVTTGDRRHGRQTWVYGRGGQPCLRCGTPVQVADQADSDYERLTYWCPHCQPPDSTLHDPRGTVPRSSR
jgi:endonuclease VIII